MTRIKGKNNWHFHLFEKLSMKRMLFYSYKADIEFLKVNLHRADMYIAVL